MLGSKFTSAGGGVTLIATVKLRLATILRTETKP